MRFFSIILLLVIGGHASAVVLEPTKDADVYQFTGYTTGTTFSLNVSPDDTGHALRSLIAFDVTESSVGFAADEVESAVLELYVLAPSGAFEAFSAGNLNVYYQNSSWTESSIRWSHVSLGSLITTFNVGRYSSASSPEIIQVDLTDAVKAWLAGSKSNHGFVIQTPSPTSGASTAFASREPGSDANAIIPKLIITEKVDPDTDGDGYTDVDENTWGSDANDPNSIPVAVRIESMELHFNTWEGHLYQVEYSPDLSEWDALGSVLSGDGEDAVVNILGRTADAEFYRVADVTNLD